MIGGKKKEEFLSKRSIIGSIIFGIALWLYTSLNGSYTTYIIAPIDVKLPPNRALETGLPENVSIEVKGKGWNIFNLMFFNNSKKIVVNYQNSKISDSILRIGRADIIKGAQSFEKVELSQIIPDLIEIKTGPVGIYNVPIYSQVQIMTAEGFSQIGPVQINPSKIRISGNDRFVKDIKFWTTKAEVYENVNSSFRSMVEVTDSVPDIVSIENKEVEIIADIQQTGEITLTEIPIFITSGGIPRNHYLYPMMVSVTIRGGINIIDELSADKIKISIDYSTIINDTRGIIVPKIEVPEFMEVIKIDPPYIYHSKKTYLDKLKI